MEILDSVTMEFFDVGFCDLYLRYTDFIIFSFSICNRYSFDKLSFYLERTCQFRDVETPSSLPAALVATKCDLEAQREVSREEYRQLANTHSLPLIEVSALEDVNVTECFEAACQGFLAFHRRD